MANVNRNQGDRAHAAAAARRRPNRRGRQVARHDRQPAREGSFYSRVMKTVAAAMVVGAISVGGLAFYEDKNRMAHQGSPMVCEDSNIAGDVKVRTCYSWVDNPVGDNDTGSALKKAWTGLIGGASQQGRNPDYMVVRHWRKGQDNPDITCKNLNKNWDYCPEVYSVLNSAISMKSFDQAQSYEQS